MSNLKYEELENVIGGEGSQNTDEKAKRELEEKLYETFVRNM